MFHPDFVCSSRDLYDKLRADVWPDVPVSERMKIARVILHDQKKILSIKEHIGFSVAKQNTDAMYVPEKRQISVSEGIFNAKNADGGFQLFANIVHEAKHAQQHQLIERILNGDVSADKLSVQAQAIQLEFNRENKLTFAGKDVFGCYYFDWDFVFLLEKYAPNINQYLGFGLYYLQPNEYDARIYLQMQLRGLSRSDIFLGNNAIEYMKKYSPIPQMQRAASFWIQGDEKKNIHVLANWLSQSIFAIEHNGYMLGNEAFDSHIKQFAVLSYYENEIDPYFLSEEAYAIEQQNISDIAEHTFLSQEIIIDDSANKNDSITKETDQFLTDRDDDKIYKPKEMLGLPWDEIEI